MDDVAREAGISKKTLYRLVPTKADLLKATISLARQCRRGALDLDDPLLAAGMLKV